MGFGHHLLGDLGLGERGEEIFIPNSDETLLFLFLDLHPRRLRFVYETRNAKRVTIFRKSTCTGEFLSSYLNQTAILKLKIVSEARGEGRDKVGLEFGGIIEWYRPSYSKRESWSEYNVLVLKTTQCHRARKYTPGDARHSRKSVVLKIPAKRKSSIQQLFGPQSSRSIYPNFPQTVDKEFFPRYSRNSIQLPYIYIL